ncbi:TIGR01777 family oxidoreductase [Arsenophonus sp.]|uniref:TIGR01777 family oxidoreductase n=1 Tax=Arsenophonus sp. TaxID=1872640 RepID=UPI0028593E44|nr:TIGR01777 family oxidoreductase [Arsenophonus sp.]MDR5616086.1 TIGR01777 family oxidoreductase [Arsenophonus sp.]
MRIFITGSTGLIGSRLVQQLVIHSHTITVLSRSCQKVYSLFGRHVDCLTSLNEINNLDGFDAIVNLAGEPIANKPWTKEQKIILCESRWKMTERLSQLIKDSKKPPKTFISGSAVGYYGDQGQSVVTESDMPHTEFTHKLCQKWESLALEAESDKTRVCLLRTGVVLAKEGGVLKKLLPIFKAGLGGPIGKGKQYIPWIHIDDVVNAINYLLESPSLSGAFNITSPYPVHNDQFSAILAEVLNRPAVIRTPEFVIKSIMGESAALMLGGQQAIPKRLEEAGFKFHYIELKEALESLLLTTSQETIT